MALVYVLLLIHQTPKSSELNQNHLVTIVLGYFDRINSTFGLENHES
ncbi:hypothetical protein AA637_15945 (plasmid) [Cyanobacterium sp. HL-69]|nr:hypothetical protein AA637_15945 [Cyanobacterium sp. HL-69]